MYSHFISWILFNQRRQNSQRSNPTCCLSYTVNTMPADTLVTLKDLWHQQAWYWPNKLDYSISSIWRVYFLISEHMLGIRFTSNLCKIALRWVPKNTFADKSKFVQIMSWCRQATSHCLSQCWPISIVPKDVTAPQWVKWRHMATETWVNIGSGNGLLPSGNKPLPEPMLTYHQ